LVVALDRKETTSITTRDGLGRALMHAPHFLWANGVAHNAWTRPCLESSISDDD
jgi:hypothetical protein